MNKLVENMIKHHQLGGNAIYHVKVDEIMELAKDPEDKHQLAATTLRRDRDWSREETPGDLFAVGIWSKIYWKKAQV